MARVIHFDLLAKDPKRAAEFYENAFGWKLEKWGGPMEYWLIMTGETSQPGIDGGLGIGEPTLKEGELTLGVDSLEAAITKVKKHDGKVVREKAAIPGVGWFATVEGPDGNVFGLMQEDRAAK